MTWVSVTKDRETAISTILSLYIYICMYRVCVYLYLDGGLGGWLGMNGGGGGENWWERCGD